MAIPSAKPIAPPMAKPLKARQVLAPMLWRSSPERRSRQQAARTADGAGKTLVEIRPVRAAASQTMTSRAGRIQPMEPLPSGEFHCVTRGARGAAAERGMSLPSSTWRLVVMAVPGLSLRDSC